MIGIIRVRLDTDPAALGWTDQEWQTLMDPNARFSLAHYWRTCSFGRADLAYRLFAPVTITDPQPTMTPTQVKADPKFRTTRTKVITQAVDDQFHPDWSAFTCLIIWVASPMDLWGSNAFNHGQGTCAVMMCDIGSRFDQLCHELGHTQGFEHPFGREGLEYNSAYDVMGGYDSEWKRSSLPAFPVGVDADDASDPMLRIGPMLSGAQLSASGYRAQVPNLFVDVPNVTAPQTLKIFALDGAASRWPIVDGPVAAVLPPDPVSPDFHYVIELRRSSGYDEGLRSTAHPNAPHPGIVVHGLNATMKRFFFAGVLPLSSRVGDRDLHVYSGLPGGDFTIRLLEVGPDDEWARIRVGGPNYWRNFGVDLDIQQEQQAPQYSAWTDVDVKPCVFAEAGTHSYRYRTVASTYVIDARSFGYESPSYTWTINGTAVTRARGTLRLDVQSSVPNPVEGWNFEPRTVRIAYKLSGARLELAAPAGNLAVVGKFTLPIDVTVHESSHEVLVNNYPDQSITTALRYDNVDIEWDESYRQALDHCKNVADEVDRKRIPVPLPQLPGGYRPDDDLPNVLDVLSSLVESNPAAANVLIEQVGRTAGISNLAVIARLQLRNR